MWKILITPKPKTHRRKARAIGNLLYPRWHKDDVIEVDREGNIVWRWRAEDHFMKNSTEWWGPLRDWTHVNAVTRMDNGYTMIDLRNFNMIIIVNRDGNIVWYYGKGVLNHQHDPELLSNNHLLIPDSANNRVIEIDMDTRNILWKY